jgi:hypothetical protein
MREGDERKYLPSTTIQQDRHHKTCKHPKQVPIQTWKTHEGTQAFILL